MQRWDIRGSCSKRIALLGEISIVGATKNFYAFGQPRLRRFFQYGETAITFSYQQIFLRFFKLDGLLTCSFERALLGHS